MKRLSLCIVIVGLAYVASARSQTIDFRGVPMGSSEKALRNAAPFLDCKDVSPANRAGGDRMCHAFFLERKKSTAKEKFAGADSNYLAQFYEDKLASISVTLSHIHYGAAAAALTEKFGQPTSRSVKEIRTAMGIKGAGEVLTWKRADSQVEIEEYGSSINTSSVHYSLATALAEFSKRNAAVAKQNAKGL